MAPVGLRGGDVQAGRTPRRRCPPSKHSPPRERMLQGPCVPGPGLQTLPGAGGDPQIPSVPPPAPWGSPNVGLVLVVLAGQVARRALVGDAHHGDLLAVAGQVARRGAAAALLAVLHRRVWGHAPLGTAAHTPPPPKSLPPGPAPTQRVVSTLDVDVGRADGLVACGEAAGQGVGASPTPPRARSPLGGGGGPVMGWGRPLGAGTDRTLTWHVDHAAVAAAHHGLLLALQAAGGDAVGVVAGQGLLPLHAGPAVAPRLWQVGELPGREGIAAGTHGAGTSPGLWGITAARQGLGLRGAKQRPRERHHPAVPTAWPPMASP